MEQQSVTHNQWKRPIILLIGAIAAITIGYTLVRTIINLQNRAAVSNLSLLAGEACRLETAVCKVNTSTIPTGSDYRLEILGNGNPVITAPVNQPTLVLEQTQIGISYSCRVLILDDKGNPYPNSSCKAEANAKQSCTNCTCQDTGKLSSQTFADGPVKFFQTIWKPEQNSCPAVTSTCTTIKIFPDSPDKAGITPIHEYKCDPHPTPHPTTRLHQAVGTGKRDYFAVSYDQNGIKIDDRACRAEENFACPDSCSFAEIPGDCDQECNFTIDQGTLNLKGGESGPQACLKLDEFFRFILERPNDYKTATVFFDDDDDPRIIDLPKGVNSRSYKYDDAGVYDIRTTCFDGDTVFSCRKRLVIGCPGDKLSPSPSPSPTPPGCPAVDINIQIPSCEECSQ